MLGTFAETHPYTRVGDRSTCCTTSDHGRSWLKRRHANTALNGFLGSEQTPAPGASRSRSFKSPEVAARAISPARGRLPATRSSFERPSYCDKAITSRRRHTSTMLSLPRRPSRTILLLSSVEKRHCLGRRVFLIVSSAEPEGVIGLGLKVACPRGDGRATVHRRGYSIGLMGGHTDHCRGQVLGRRAIRAVAWVVSDPSAQLVLSVPLQRASNVGLPDEPNRLWAKGA